MYLKWWLIDRGRGPEFKSRQGMVGKIYTILFVYTHGIGSLHFLLSKYFTSNHMLKRLSNIANPLSMVVINLQTFLK